LKRLNRCSQNNYTCSDYENNPQKGEKVTQDGDNE
jgi:hypothetical protein